MWQGVAGEAGKGVAAVWEGLRRAEAHLEELRGESGRAEAATRSLGVRLTEAARRSEDCMDQLRSELDAALERLRDQAASLRRLQVLPPIKHLCLLSSSFHLRDQAASFRRLRVLAPLKQPIELRPPNMNAPSQYECVLPI